MKKKVALFLGPIAFILIEIWGTGTPINHVLAVLAWMLVWWISEIVNLAVTALLPLVLFPILGVDEIKSVASNYAHPIVYLFFGGFVLALAIEKWNLHKRIALNIIKFTGVNARQILLGFMIATAFLSMWISNTATTIMMLPMALSVLEVANITEKEKNKMAFLLLVSVAWSANIGGMMTLIGTPPNLIFSGFVKDHLNLELTFSHWLIVGFPVGILMLLFTYLIMSRFLPKTDLFNGNNVIADELETLGRISVPEKRVALVFFLTAVAWIVRPFVVNAFEIEGVSDTTVALACAVCLFLIPNGNDERLLDWSDTKNLSWGILVLFGGGLALAAGIKSSGMLVYIEQYISGLQVESIFMMVAIMAFIGIFATELVSNMALVAATLPLVLAISSSLNLDFMTLALPLTLGASCAFMLPMATPPNAIVFSSGKIRIEKMARYGFVINVVAFAVISFICYWLGSYVA